VSVALKNKPLGCIQAVCLAVMTGSFVPSAASLALKLIQYQTVTAGLEQATAFLF